MLFSFAAAAWPNAYITKEPKASTMSLFWLWTAEKSTPLQVLALA